MIKDRMTEIEPETHEDGYSKLCEALQKGLTLRVHNTENDLITAELKSYWRIKGYGKASTFKDAILEAGLDYASNHQYPENSQNIEKIPQDIASEWVLRGNSFEGSYCGLWKTRSKFLTDHLGCWLEKNRKYIIHNYSGFVGMNLEELSELAYFFGTKDGRKYVDGGKQFSLCAIDTNGEKIMNVINPDFEGAYSHLCCILRSIMGLWEKDDWQKAKAPD